MKTDKKEYFVGDTVLFNEIPKILSTKHKEKLESLKQVRGYFKCILWRFNFDKNDERYGKVILTFQGMRDKALYVASCKEFLPTNMVLIEKINFKQQKIIKFMIATTHYE